ncbi:MAG: hypothetical protein RLZZ142_2250 [Verrucomicrobiota bacterium]
MRSLPPVVASVLLLALVLPASALAKDSPGARPALPEKLKADPTAAPETPDAEEPLRKTSDPIEWVNRGTFSVNHQLYRFLLRPLADATEAVLPKPVLRCLGNFFTNLETPSRVVSSLLQADLSKASKETSKLLLNSSIGIGGLFRPSDRLACLANVPSEDLGQAFGKWGIPSGPYLVLPVLGPSSCRDFPGKVADSLLNPATWVGSPSFRYIVNGTRGVEENPRRMKAYSLATDGALDRYIAVREGFLDFRAEAIRR